MVLALLIRLYRWKVDPPNMLYGFKMSRVGGDQVRTSESFPLSLRYTLPAFFTIHDIFAPRSQGHDARRSVGATVLCLEQQIHSQDNDTALERATVFDIYPGSHSRLRQQQRRACHQNAYRGLSDATSSDVSGALLLPVAIPPYSQRSRRRTHFGLKPYVAPCHTY